MIHIVRALALGHAWDVEVSPEQEQVKRKGRRDATEEGTDGRAVIDLQELSLGARILRTGSTIEIKCDFNVVDSLRTSVSSAGGICKHPG